MSLAAVMSPVSVSRPPRGGGCQACHLRTVGRVVTCRQCVCPVGHSAHYQWRVSKRRVARRSTCSGRGWKHRTTGFLRYTRGAACYACHRHKLRPVLVLLVTRRRCCPPTRAAAQQANYATRQWPATPVYLSRLHRRQRTHLRRRDPCAAAGNALASTAASIETESWITARSAARPARGGAHRLQARQHATTAPSVARSAPLTFWLAVALLTRARTSKAWLTLGAPRPRTGMGTARRRHPVGARRLFRPAHRFTWMWVWMWRALVTAPLPDNTLMRVPG